MSWQYNFNLKITKAYKWIIMFCNNGEMIDDLHLEWLFDVEYREWGKYISQWQHITFLFFTLYYSSMGRFSARDKNRTVLGKEIERVSSKD